MIKTVARKFSRNINYLLDVINALPSFPSESVSDILFVSVGWAFSPPIREIRFLLRLINVIQRRLSVKFTKPGYMNRNGDISLLGVKATATRQRLEESNQLIGGSYEKESYWRTRENRSRFTSRSGLDRSRQPFTMQVARCWRRSKLSFTLLVQRQLIFWRFLQMTLNIYNHVLEYGERGRCAFD